MPWSGVSCSFDVQTLVIPVSYQPAGCTIPGWEVSSHHHSGQNQSPGQIALISMQKQRLCCIAARKELSDSHKVTSLAAAAPGAWLTLCPLGGSRPLSVTGPGSAAPGPTDREQLLPPSGHPLRKPRSLPLLEAL